MARSRVLRAQLVEDLAESVHRVGQEVGEILAIVSLDVRDVEWGQPIAMRLAFPIRSMRACAQSFKWGSNILDRIQANTRTLPGQAAIPWRRELAEREAAVRAWASSLKLVEDTAPAEVSQLNLIAFQLAETERKLIGRRPELRERVSKSIERGSIGQLLERAAGFRCQICDALGLNPVGFLKKDGEPYVEAHHATPVSELEVGSLSATNIMILCANHHRQLHYGQVILARTEHEFLVSIQGHVVRIKRFAIE